LKQGIAADAYFLSLIVIPEGPSFKLSPADDARIVIRTPVPFFIANVPAPPPTVAAAAPAA
jgi:hypothetical protein